jgi:hypothetical protein
MLTGAVLTAAPPVAQAQSKAVQIGYVPCSSAMLFMAIGMANAGTGPGTLRLARNCPYNIPSQLPPIIGNVTLLGGPSTTIQHDPSITGNFRILDVASTGRLRVQGIFIRFGNPSGANGGGIQNAGSLVLNFVTLSENIAGTAAVGGNGGGLANLTGARALVAHTVIKSNNSTVATPALANTGNGGGIFNQGSLTLFESRLDANNATGATSVPTTGNGGGINTQPGGTSRIIQSTIAENTATNNGGGIFNAGITSLYRTLVVRNRAATGGGVSGTVTIRRSIIRGNTPTDCVPTNPACS